MAKKTRLKSNQSFSYRRSAILIVLLVCLGVAIKFLTHASQVVLAFEAESMSYQSGLAQIVTDSNASGSQALELYSNSSGTKAVNIASAADTIIIRARGTQCKGSPQAKLTIDNISVATFTVSTNTWANYSVSKALTAGSHTVKVNFTNDYSRRNCDRNLYIDKVSLLGSTPVDTTLPSISIVSPASGSTVSGTLSVTASASDNVGVSKVEFLLDGSLKSVSLSSPYSYSLDTASVSNGTHTITAKAYDAAGNTASASSTVNVSNTTTINYADLFKKLVFNDSNPNNLSEVKPIDANSGSYISWYYHPVQRNAYPPSGWTAMIMWGTLFQADGSATTSTSARVELRDAQAWVLSKSTGQWTRVSYSTNTKGALYNTDWSNASTPADAYTNSSGSTSVGTVNKGTTYHFWPSTGRASINPADVAAITTAVRARLEPGTYSSATPPRYTLCVAADWWRSLTATFASNYSNNEDAGIGRFKAIDGNWRLFTHTTLLNATTAPSLPPITVNSSELR